MFLKPVVSGGGYKLYPSIGYPVRIAGSHEIVCSVLKATIFTECWCERVEYSSVFLGSRGSNLLLALLHIRTE